MKVDRSLFLVLTGTLSAGACQVYVGDDKPKTPQAAAPGTQPPPTANPSTPTAPPATPQRVVNLKLEGHGATTPPAPSGGSTPPPPSPSCFDNAAATIPDCASMQPADSSCAPFPFVQQKCAGYKAYLNPKVAAAAVSCMTALTSKQVCDATYAYNCGKSALAQACPDPTVAQLCQIAAAPCRTSASDCASMLSGLNDQGKQTIAQCVAQGCQYGLYSCIEGLTSPAAASSKARLH
jgi:hypothetical protein